MPPKSFYDTLAGRHSLVLGTFDTASADRVFGPGSPLEATFVRRYDNAEDARLVAEALRLVGVEDIALEIPEDDAATLTYTTTDQHIVGELMRQRKDVIDPGLVSVEVRPA